MNYFRIYVISRKMRVGEGWSASETCARQVRAMTESNQTCSASSNCPSSHKMALARFSPNNLICDVILRLAPPAGACRRSVTSLWVLSASQTAACWRMLPNKFICFNSIVLPSRASVCASLRRKKWLSHHPAPSPGVTPIQKWSFYWTIRQNLLSTNTIQV